MTYIKHLTVKWFLKKALTMAYPDPNHRIRHLERCFTSHCLYISACLALVSVGAPSDDIIYRLRWNSDVVDSSPSAPPAYKACMPGGTNQ
jgi:hypothetical protein